MGPMAYRSIAAYKQLIASFLRNWFMFKSDNYIHATHVTQYYLIEGTQLLIRERYMNPVVNFKSSSLIPIKFL